jgi:hypothetical protein
MRIDTKAQSFQVHTLIDPSAPISVLGAQFDEQWLPVLSPTTVCLMRYLARHATPEGIELDSYELACRIGAPNRSKLRRALDRAEHHGFLVADTPTSFGVWTAVRRTDKGLIRFNQRIAQHANGAILR